MQDEKKTIKTRLFAGLLSVSLVGSNAGYTKVYAQEQETTICEGNVCRILSVHVPDNATVYAGQNKTMNITKSLQEGYKQKCTTSDSSIATVTNTGKIKGIKKGTVTITTTIYGEHVQKKLKFSTKVNVKNPSIKIVASKKKVKIGKTLQLSVKKVGITGTESWSVNKKTIATINKKTGKLKGKKAGTVKVTVKCASLKKSIKIKVVK